MTDRHDHGSRTVRALDARISPDFRRLGRRSGVPILAIICPAAAALIALALPPAASAVDYSGTVQFEGQTQFAAPIAGINPEDLVVSVGTETESTGNGEKCSVLSTTNDNADVFGAYPSLGQVSADMLLERGGPQIPDGACVLTVRATATDGVSVSARGSQTVFVPAQDIDTSATIVVPEIVVRESKAIAGVGKECTKWVKKQLKLRAKCNFLLLKKGPEAALKCRDEGPEPTGCDPGDFVEAILALSHGSNDQQVDPLTAELIDSAALKDQVICQKRLGKAAAGFAAKRILLIDKKCVATGLDSDSCRSAETNTAKKKLDQIAKCIGDQLADDGTGREVPDAGAPCDVCIDGLGVFDQKCMRACFETTLSELTDGIIGDVPECGNGIVQSGEFCDDGGLADGDCCSSSCTAENLGDQTCGVGACEVTVAACTAGEPVSCTPGSPGVEGPNGDPSCGDGIDNDCDGSIDGGDTDCQ